MNGAAGKAPLPARGHVGTPVTLDAAGTRDPDGHPLRYTWFFYPRLAPASRITGRGAGATTAGGGSRPGRGEHPVGAEPADRGSRRRASRSTGAGTSRATATPIVAGTAHVILAVEDTGTPSLTSYRRVILAIAPQ